MQNYTEEQISNTFGGFYIIDINEKNLAETYEKWCFNGIYKRSQTDGILYWQIGYNNETKKLISLHGHYLTVTGSSGSLIKDELDIVENLSGRSYKSQAYLEAHKKYIDKNRQGYSTDITGTENLINELPGVQLAVNYPLDLKGGKSPISDYNFSIGLSAQPKLDGIRARITKEIDGVKIYSRNNKEYRYLDNIRRESKMILDLLPPNVGIDGEIYSLDMSFEELTSVVRTVKTKHIKNDLLICYLFDVIILNVRLEDRIKMLHDSYLSIRNSGYEFKHVFVLKDIIIHSHQEVISYHNSFVRAGYEGLMLRFLSGNNPSKIDLQNSYYRPGKNKALMKVKNFFDAEATVIDFKQGEGREKGAVIWVLRDNITGKVFDCRPRGSYSSRVYYFQHGNEYIGKIYTYRYFELTSDNIPRFATGVSFRDYE